MLKCTVTTLPFAKPSTVRGPIEILDTLIGPTTGPCPYGINISILEGDIVASTRSKSTSGISTRKEFSSETARTFPSASHVSPPSKLQPMAMSLGGLFCSAATAPEHAQEKRQKVNSHGFLHVMVCVRRQRFWDRRRPNLSESLAHSV